MAARAQTPEARRNGVLDEIGQCIEALRRAQVPSPTFWEHTRRLRILAETLGEIGATATTSARAPQAATSSTR